MPTRIHGHRKLGTIGLPYPDTDIRIVDKETGTKELPPLPFAVADTGGLTKEQSEEAAAYTGELIVRGPQVMKGYLNKPDETAATLRDGWLYTGDIACIDQDGYTIIRDRAKDRSSSRDTPSSPQKWRIFSISTLMCGAQPSSGYLTKKWERS